MAVEAVVAVAMVEGGAKAVEWARAKAVAVVRAARVVVVVKAVQSSAQLFQARPQLRFQAALKHQLRSPWQC